MADEVAPGPGCLRRTACVARVLHLTSIKDTRTGLLARVRSVALNILRANGVQNISLALHANAVSFDQLLALGTV